MPNVHSGLFKVPETYPGPEWHEKFLKVHPSSWAEQTADLQAQALFITLTPRWSHGPSFFDMDWPESKYSCKKCREQAEMHKCISLLVSDFPWGLVRSAASGKSQKTIDEHWGTHRRCLEMESMTWWSPMVRKQTRFSITFDVLLSEREGCTFCPSKEMLHGMPAIFNQPIVLNGIHSLAYVFWCCFLLKIWLSHQVRFFCRKILKSFWTKVWIYEFLKEILNRSKVFFVF